MNKKVIAALFSALALGTASVAAAADEKPAAEGPAKNEKATKKGHKKPDDKGSGDGTKVVRPEPVQPPVT